MQSVDRETAYKISRAIGCGLFDQNGYHAKTSAQRNLQGKTHYADDDTLRFFSARINRCRPLFGGLILMICETTADGPGRSSRGHRCVAFDLFGAVINDRRGLDQLHASSDKALREFESWAESFDPLAHYRQAMDDRAKRLHREAAHLEKAAADLVAQ